MTFEKLVVDEVDVLICGGGPVGLLIGYCLARYGISTHVIEEHERAKQTRYGRAAMIAPRTLEMLDQLDLADALGQIGFVVRGQVSYKNGERAESLTAASSNITDTFFDYLLLCRQRYTEDVIRDGYAGCSHREVHNGAKLVDFSINEGGSFPVTSTIETQDKGQSIIQSKFIIGADGGRSKVRELAGIPFEGERSSRNWIRIDGIVETNMPEARGGICGIESKSHGSVLWACLDHGVTRVGFALPHKLWEELGANITQDDVIQEAKKALHPFSLEFKTVDWWTVYSVGQRLAAKYRARDRVFIAGDAGHTHSSGAAQGMNTGLHDAVNLSWKLAGHINGWLAEKVLDTYQTERRPIAKRIIDQDKIISVLVGGEIPEAYKEDPNADPHHLLTETYKANASLNSGLGIRYPPESLIVIDSIPRQSDKLSAGERAPDVLLQRPGLRIPLRLYSISKSDGKFTMLHFCGDPVKTRTLLQGWRHSFDTTNALQRYSTCVSSPITIMIGSNTSGSPPERLGFPSFGEVFYDLEGAAHERYGIADDKGAIFILRPDGTIGIICELGDGETMATYFKRFVIDEKDSLVSSTRDYRVQSIPTTGEVDLEQEQGSGGTTRVAYETA